MLGVNTSSISAAVGGRRMYRVGEVLRPRHELAPNARGRRRQVVCGVAKLDVAVLQQQPVGAWFSERHAHASGVHHARPPDHPVERHVRVTADDDGRVQAVEDRQEPFFRRQRP